MQDSYSDAYAEAGVDITAGYRGVELMQEHIARTMIPGAGGIGGFGGVFELLNVRGMKEPCLVSGTDGVGTKIRIAQLLDRHDTIGIDCVAMCVNDIVCSGARPLFFLDYIAIGKNVPAKVAGIVKGIAEGCVQAGCALIGGETAEHPGLMKPDDYDVAGFAVGIVDKADMLSKDRVRPGDILVGLLSNGLHSNGYSLVRKVFDVENADLSVRLTETETTLGEELLRPTEIYVKPVLAAIAAGGVHAAAHITGGGLIENLQRSIPEGLQMVLDDFTWGVPAIMGMVAERGRVSVHDMLNTFNMGLGMILICGPEAASAVAAAAEQAGARTMEVGRVEAAP